ncbi:MAG: hydrolase [Gammaproteobacteria bacterium]|nr:hydrolase [Gammaproteobacteria bacterium]
MKIELLDKHPCPCCGYLVHLRQPGYHQVCPICGWEDDLAQLRFVEMPGSANQVSLIKAQVNYMEYGASEKRSLVNSREPVPGELRDREWRSINPARDNIEEPAAGINYSDSYPKDSTVLYYWRSTYWRRIVG